MSQSTPVASVATQSSDARVVDTALFMAILNKRITLKPANAGEQHTLTIQGNPQFLTAGYQYPDPSGTGMLENKFSRTIYNVRANSALKMADKANRALLSEAIKAESAGDMVTATELFNDYLNAVQLSFSVIERPGALKLSKGNQVIATVDVIDTKAGARAIVLNDVSLKPAIVAAPTKFDLSDLIDL
jgi:hypothetical protein